MSLPSPLCFSPRPWGSGAAWWPCRARFHAPASAQSLLARRMLLPAEAVCPGLPFLRSARCGGAPATGIFTSPLLSGVGHAVWGQGGLPGHSILSVGALWVRFPALPGSHRILPAQPGISPRRGRGWAEPRVVPVRGSLCAPEAPAATSATETLRRVGAARSHLPLIEFICYNPKQCKAGFSQAPAACLPIKIPSRTANPPSRLDIKQPVSKKRQEKSPCVRAQPLLPILLPQGRGLQASQSPFWWLREK